MGIPEIINIENHRSRRRIRELGEVFTSDLHVNQMLDLFSPRIWADESSYFFEPTCGHGNFVTAILHRRISALANKYSKQAQKDHHLYAIATAVNTIWAIDIEPVNIELTRQRAITLIVDTLKPFSFPTNKKGQNFLAHVLCAIYFQIHENEALSSLNDDRTAIEQASKTRSGKKWVSKNRHTPIDFQMTWAEFFQQSRTPCMLFKRASAFVQGLMNGNTKGYGEFGFARDAIKTLLDPSEIKKEKAA